jgi:plasmid stability protein
VANLQIKGLPDDLHEELRRRAAQAGMTVRDYVLQLIRRDQSLPAMRDWLDALRAHEPVDLGRPAAEWLAAARREWEEE